MAQSIWFPSNLQILATQIVRNKWILTYVKCQERYSEPNMFLNFRLAARTWWPVLSLPEILDLYFFKVVEVEYFFPT